MDSIKRFIADDQGADLVEYALLVGLIALACTTLLGNIGGHIKDIFTTIDGKITTANTAVGAAGN